MSQIGVDYLTEQVALALDYCWNEFDMTLEETVGTLQVAIQILIDEKTIQKEEDRE